MKLIRTIICVVFLAITIPVMSQQAVGIFSGSGDVGPVIKKGSASYNPSGQVYELGGAGINIWGRHDEFQFAWKKMKGNFILQARGELVGKGVELHRKFGWMVRSTLDTGSTVACATVHGDGLTSLQYRKTTNGNMVEKRSDVKGPDMIQLERRGALFIMSVAHFGEPYSVIEADSIELGDDVYVGLFICSHNKDVVEKVTFKNVRIIVPAKDNFTPYRDYIGSSIETMDVETGTRQVLYSVPNSIQAPNWTPDNKSLIYNSSAGVMYRFDLATGKPETLNTDTVIRNNNDHVLSMDGKMLGLSSRSGPYNSVVWTVPATGGKPKLITPIGPSYLHGWSPDKKWLIFTGIRNNNPDIYKVPSNGGPEIRLTTDTALDDGSEYTPDGKYIYFNSTRTGLMQIWRMKPDGSGQEQVTNDEYNNWFPHISPDGKWICILSYQKDIKANDHPFYKHVYLRLMPITGGQPKVIAYLYGGQGSINTPSWSPDNKKIAFVSNSDMSNQ